MSKRPSNRSTAAVSSTTSKRMKLGDESQKTQVDEEAEKTLKMKYNEIKGDLFSCSADTSLAHCISEDCRLGKGIAVLFKKKFEGITDLKDQVQKGKKTGKTAVLKRGSRFVYYMITKKAFWNKPTYDSLKASLQDMKSHCQKEGVTKLAMPKIGCGLDGLKWSMVSEIIKDVFKDCQIDITVFHL